MNPKMVFLECMLLVETLPSRSDFVLVNPGRHPYWQVQKSNLKQEKDGFIIRALEQDTIDPG